MKSIMKMRQCGLVLLFLALPGASLWAAEIGDQAKQNVISGPQSGLAWMSGGIGDEARDEMHKAAAAYNVHLVFSEPQGNYLAGIPFAVVRPDGRSLYSGISAGPLLYLKLPAGTYLLNAQLGGVWHQQRIEAGTNENPARVSFVATGAR